MAHNNFAPARRMALVSCAAAAAAVGCRPSIAPHPSSQRAAIAVVPRPAESHELGGTPFVLRDSSVILTQSGDTAAWRVAGMLVARLRPATDFALPVDSTAAARARPGHIRLAVEPSRADLGDEGYALVAAPDSVVAVAATAAGLFHATQTIRQLLPATIESDIGVQPDGGWTIPAISIVDRPRFAWRGAMLDPARHFLTVDEIRQYVDLIAMYKLNVLHLHLSDDQGWRIEIRSRPALASVGGRMEVGGGSGGFYTQEEFREIVRYAADRFITIIPEIEMPAHAYALTSAYPAAGCNALCPDSTESYRVIDDVVREIAGMSPAPWFHVGGDEVATLTHDQYTRFIERVQDIVASHGKRMIGWEEIVQARLAPTTMVQEWRTDTTHAALATGMKVILSPADRVYLDMKYDRATELGLDWAALVDVRASYDWNPAAYLPGVAESNLAGIEAPLWGETVRNITAAFYLAVPRLPAIAEVAWTAQASRSWPDFRARIASHAPRWRLLGINYYASPQIAWF